MSVHGKSVVSMQREREREREREHYLKAIIEIQLSEKSQRNKK
jgi:hypothetical protein